jgi:hypothetical protein
MADAHGIAIARVPTGALLPRFETRTVSEVDVIEQDFLSYEQHLSNELELSP